MDKETSDMQETAPLEKPTTTDSPQHAAERAVGADRALAAGNLRPVTRRRFLQGSLAVAAAAVAGCSEAPSAESPVRWGMLVDLKKCVGCRACMAACKAENHTPPGVSYNLVMEEEIGSYPNVRREFTFRPCMQCAKSSCTKVCPTGATYHRPDGVVVINYDQCIGCRYCIEACPYGARSFDYGHDYYAEPTPYDKQPSPEYGENRVRKHNTSPIGNVRKCTFCIHRVKKGLAPACAETCIGRAIHFGNLKDPEARCLVHGEKLQELLATRHHIRLKEELGNEPAVYYLT
ncbi:MAG: 4Fe-4S dicluster domain-containing protein [Candidatus Dadabacteria bacterium]|nr:MAG: 4Fe-4S dicluster domain-containing protein [Candidatus Dadabacteria bacterium]